jgi:hypothetical protein
MNNTYRGLEIEDPEFRCSNCDGCGYFDTPDDGEKPCTVCRGKGAYTQEEIDALTGQAELTAAVRAHLSAYGNDRLFIALDEAHARVATLQSWIAAACNADHTLMPPAGIEIFHRVAPTAHDWQDDSKEQGA